MEQNNKSLEVFVTDIVNVVVTNSDREPQTHQEGNRLAEKSNFNVIVKSPNFKSTPFKRFVETNLGNFYSDFIELKGIQFLSMFATFMIPLFLFQAKSLYDEKATENSRQATRDLNQQQTLNGYLNSIREIQYGSDASPRSQYEKHNLIRQITLVTLGELTEDEDRKARVALFLDELGVTNVKKINELCELEESKKVIATENCIEKLENFYLAGDLKNAEFPGVSLGGVTFRNADLRGANFSETKSEGVNFEVADLREASFSGAFIYDISFRNANLENTNFSNAKLEVVDFEYAGYENEHLENAEWKSLKNANFSDANLHNIKFTNANLQNVDFSNTELEKVDFEGADLYKANFENAEIHDANFKGTNVTCEQLQKATFTNIVFSDSSKGCK